MKITCVGVSDKTDQLRAFNVSKSKSAGDLIAELKAHSGVGSLRKVTPRSTVSSSADKGPADNETERLQEFKLVTLRHVNAALP